MKPTEDLMRDHQTIEVMLGIITKIVEKIKKNREPELEEIDRIIDFLKIFADKFHHGKEETIYFPELIEAGMSNKNSPVAVMLFEHEVGRGLIKSIASAVQSIRNGDKPAIDQLVEFMESYVELMENHIQKENNILFPMGDKLLPPLKRDLIYKHFKVVEENVIGQDIQKHYHELLRQLEKKYLA